MGWGHFTHSIKKAVSNPKNVAAAVAAPFTAGASLLALEDNSGYSVLDGLRGVPDVDKQNKFNANQAQLNRDWQENMSNTAYQRGYADLLAAGLNPNLAGGSGGASTPGGAQATSAGLPESPGALMANVATAGAEMATGLKTLEESKYIGDTAKANIGNTIANTAKTQAETSLTNANTQLAEQQFKLLTLQEQEQIINLAQKYIDAPNQKVRSQLNNEFMETKFGKLMSKYIGGSMKEKIGQLLVPLVGLFK